jgi:hypothetical protein
MLIYVATFPGVSGDLASNTSLREHTLSEYYSPNHFSALAFGVGDVAVR